MGVIVKFLEISKLCKLLDKNFVEAAQLSDIIPDANAIKNVPSIFEAFR